MKNLTNRNGVVYLSIRDPRYRVVRESIGWTITRTRRYPKIMGIHWRLAQQPPQSVDSSA